jgi:hypothetical protein
LAGPAVEGGHDDDGADLLALALELEGDGRGLAVVLDLARPRAEDLVDAGGRRGRRRRHQ